MTQQKAFAMITAATTGPLVVVDGNEAIASAAHRLCEVVVVNPMTPSTPMGDLMDRWSSQGRKNVWSQVPQVVAMQGQGGSAGALHGALQAGSLAVTTSASHGLLQMLPEMHRIAGAHLPAVIHVAARTVASHALAIGGEHGDVMAARGAGWGMLCSSTVQECHDLAAVAHASALSGRLPMLHWCDGFRTSHELMPVRLLSDADLRSLFAEAQVATQRRLAMDPDQPNVRGTTQGPDVFFQGRQASAPDYGALVGVVQDTLDRLAVASGRRYGVVEYVGHPEAERVVVGMGSGIQACLAAARVLAEAGERVGVLIVRLYRPFPVAAVLAALPATVRALAVLDRCWEPGAPAEPLYLDVLSALATGGKPLPALCNARYGLGGKELTPAMILALFAELAAARPRARCTLGIRDDIGATALPWDADCLVEPEKSLACICYAVGGDGSAHAARQNIRILVEGAKVHAQGYVVYDARRSGAVSISHLRIAPNAFQAPWLVPRAQLIAVHHPSLLSRLDVLKRAAPGATVLLNLPGRVEDAWDQIPQEMQRSIIEREAKVFAVDAHRIAREAGLGMRVGTILQTCLLSLTGLLPRKDLIARVKKAAFDDYGKRGATIVDAHAAAVDSALDALAQVEVPANAAGVTRRLTMPADASPFVRQVLGTLIAGRGDRLPVSALPRDGVFPSGTSRHERRTLATHLPQWNSDICTQCGKCTLVCPHAAIRATAIEPHLLANAPKGFSVIPCRNPAFPSRRYTIQVSADDCTGCQLCVAACPAKDRSKSSRKALEMHPATEVREITRSHWDFFTRLPEVPRGRVGAETVADSQLLRPLFECSGACPGCGQTPYVRLLSQLFGDRLLVANATGCSSIYGGHLPTTPWSFGENGRGPAWAGSLSQDGAGFALGLRLAVDHQRQQVDGLLRRLSPAVGGELASDLLASTCATPDEIAAQRRRLAELDTQLAALPGIEAERLRSIARVLVERSVWCIGGDGWANDHGGGGLDHVLASGRKVRILVLDTEGSSNTGGQTTKSTPRGAVATFSPFGKGSPKKDLAYTAMANPGVYVATVSLAANPEQCLRALREAEANPGPSIVIAYAPCIAHGIDLRGALAQEKAAVASGHWPLLRRVPGPEGDVLHLDSGEPTIPFATYADAEGRYKLLSYSDPDRHQRLLVEAEADATTRRERYRSLAAAGSHPTQGTTKD